MERHNECERHEAEMKQSMPTFEATEERNELKQSGREIQKALRDINVSGGA